MKRVELEEVLEDLQKINKNIKEGKKYQFILCQKEENTEVVTRYYGKSGHSEIGDTTIYYTIVIKI